MDVNKRQTGACPPSLTFESVDYHIVPLLSYSRIPTKEAGTLLIP